jgi:hypothetical protein
MDKVDLKTYLPDIYNGIVEAETEQDSLSIEVNKLHARYEQALMDQFVQKASLKAITYYENIFHIVANPETENLTFRRERVLSRMKMLTPPYTYYYLRIMFDQFFGKGRYILDIDNDNYTITLESAVEDSLWYHEIRASLTFVKPCNMIFINNPRVSKAVDVNDTIYAQRLIWNYKLDGSWALGLRPFYSVDGGTVYNYKLDGNWKLGAEPFIRQQGEIVKMAGTKSLEQPLFDFTLNQYKSKFYKARINDTLDIVIADYDKTVTLNTLRLAYSVTRQQVENITNIKLLDVDNTVLENANVYIPVPDTVRLAHTLEVKEDI